MPESLPVTKVSPTVCLAQSGFFCCGCFQIGSYCSPDWSRTHEVANLNFQETLCSRLQTRATTHPALIQFRFTGGRQPLFSFPWLSWHKSLHWLRLLQGFRAHSTALSSKAVPGNLCFSLIPALSCDLGQIICFVIA